MAVNSNGVFRSPSTEWFRSIRKTKYSSLPSSVMLLVNPSERRSFLWKRDSAHKGRKRCGVFAGLMTNPNDFEVGRFIGDYGFMNITSQEGVLLQITEVENWNMSNSGFSFGSYSSFQSGSFLDGGRLEDVDSRKYQNDIESLQVQDVREGPVKIRLYDGRVTQGPKKGTRVMFKVYPGKWNGGIEAEMMAANELSAHASLQDVAEDVCQNLQILLGGFETSTGEQVLLNAHECIILLLNYSLVTCKLFGDIGLKFHLFALQWLAFQNDGTYSAADYAKVMSESVSNSQAQREWKLWNPFEWKETIRRRQIFVIKILRGAIHGLAFMHDHDRLHQSLGPASVVLNTIREKDVAYLVPQVRDLAFSVDIRCSSLESGPSLLSDALWHRATRAGAFNSLEKRTFGIADDIFEAGLLLAYLAFVPFCEAGIMDGPSLQKLLESTFQLNMEAVREYCQADERLSEAVNFLDLGGCAGWELLQAMMNPDFRKRPMATTVLKHRFMTGDVL
ncbi:hypothetical protein EJ110_NYTH23467 [Nymphaea thermarum]|nr:hypothetical protein EJ110_NYTH23467 [Nymphaea thermarum]